MTAGKKEIPKTETGLLCLLFPVQKYIVRQQPSTVGSNEFGRMKTSLSRTSSSSSLKAVGKASDSPKLTSKNGRVKVPSSASNSKDGPVKQATKTVKTEVVKTTKTTVKTTKTTTVV